MVAFARASCLARCARSTSPFADSPALARSSLCAPASLPPCVGRSYACVRARARAAVCVSRASANAQHGLRSPIRRLWRRRRRRQTFARSHPRLASGGRGGGASGGGRQAGAGGGASAHGWRATMRSLARSLARGPLSCSGRVRGQGDAPSQWIWRADPRALEAPPSAPASRPFALALWAGSAGRACVEAACSLGAQRARANPLARSLAYCQPARPAVSPASQPAGLARLWSARSRKLYVRSGAPLSRRGGEAARRH